MKHFSAINPTADDPVVARTLETGDTVYFAIIIAILFLGLIMGTFLFLKNLSLSKILGEQTAMLSTIFKSIPDMLYCKDINGLYTSCNLTFETFLGVKEADVIGRDDMALFAYNPDMARQFIALDERVFREERVLLQEEKLIYPDGRERLMETIKTPLIQNGIIVGILGISRDITDLKEAMEGAKSAAEAKSSFLSRMSHEMRTPMNAIIGMTKIAENTSDVTKLKYCLSTIGTSSEMLLRIINDILDMSKIEANKIEIENAPVNIEQTLMKVSSIIKDNMEKKHQVFNVVLSDGLEHHYMTDDFRLSQILINLLSNAAKFTPDGGKITLTVEITGQIGSADTLRFSVEDSGIGMTDEQISRLFNAFEQADGSISRRYGGTGLGLAIIKNILGKMNGHIWVESTSGVGSKFSFEITLERAPTSEAANLPNSPLAQDKTQSQVPDLSGVTILLVEDVEINQEIFIALIEMTRVSVDIAENGLVAVNKFIEDPEKYDMIVMDIQMPEMDGYEATRTIRAMDLPKARSIPIIAMTANAFKEDINRCYACGMNDHLSKPIDEVAVIGKLAHYAGAL